VLRHQRISRCYTGHVFAVDQATFPEFRDLILPHVGDPHKHATLGQGFPPCRTIQEKNENPTAVPQPAATQPLQVGKGQGWRQDRYLGPGPRRQTDGAQSAAAPAPDLSWRTKCATYDGAWHGVKRISPNYEGELINWNGIVPDTKMSLSIFLLCVNNVSVFRCSEIPKFGSAEDRTFRSSVLPNFGPTEFRPTKDPLCCCLLFVVYKSRRVPV